MTRLSRLAVLLGSMVFGSGATAQVDANLQNLLAGLMQGTEVTLLTPLIDGTVQVTSLLAPGQRSATDAAALIQQARSQLLILGVSQPTGEQLAVALAGGTLTLPTGSTRVIGVLPAGSNATAKTQLISAGALPQVVPPGAAGAGGTVASVTTNGALAQLAPAQQTEALRLASQQLAALGISNPTPAQISTMLTGGTLVTPAGNPVVVGGVLSGMSPGPAGNVAPSATPQPSVSPLPAPPPAARSR